VVLENDRALLDAFRAGDRGALTTVFRAFVDDVARTLRAGVVVTVDGQRSRVGVHLPEQEIEALVQEVFAKAFAAKARKSYDGLRPYGAWLAAIARNLLVDGARQARRDAAIFLHVDDIGALPAPDVEPHAAALLEERQIAALIGGMQSTLSEPDASIFRLRFEEHASFRATARALGLTDIVVRRRDTRMRKRLLDLLRANGFLQNAQVRIGASLLSRRDGKME
jgi:RNA polymerase sigma factor (sigma-70 family)